MSGVLAARCVGREAAIMPVMVSTRERKKDDMKDIIPVLGKELEGRDKRQGRGSRRCGGRNNSRGASANPEPTPEYYRGLCSAYSGCSAGLGSWSTL
jgi:hypothetical protein